MGNTKNSEFLKTLAAFRSGDVRALSRLISLVESRDPQGMPLMASIYKGEAGHGCLGITGPPGAGKSTLVDQLIKQRRALGKTVAVLAIDPSSPFSGGAVLGDRIRMQQHAGDAGVFIRSLGSRGAHGGLSVATRDLVRLFQAFGYDEVIVETVGVGQTELDIMQVADTTVVVLVPEAGDTIQTMKAGITEIADIFVVNKSDRPGASAMVTALQQMIELGEGSVRMQDHDAHHKILPSPEEEGQGEPHCWHVEVLQTVAQKGTGTTELWTVVDAHRDFLKIHAPSPEKVSELRLEEFHAMAKEYLGHWLETQASHPRLQACKKDLASGKTNPYAAVNDLFENLIIK